jgi:hypothetical protein
MTQPTPEELLGHHLKYEIDMLVGTLLAMGRSTDIVLENALKESFCIHARALLDFFSKGRGAKKYAKAGYESFEKIKDGEVADLLRLLNNQIAHLLDGRTADDSKKISDKERHRIINILKDEIAQFKAEFLPEYLSLEIPEMPPIVFVTGPAGPTNAISAITSGPTGPCGPARGA